MHRGGVAGGDLGAHLQLQRQRGHGLHKAGLLVVNLVAVHVHQPIIFLRQGKSLVQLFHAVFAGEFKMRDSPDHVRPEP
ncbi:hypothetical protein D3C71_1956680 [compost metagenome]